jgi:hypothetical protein
MEKLSVFVRQTNALTLPENGIHFNYYFTDLLYTFIKVLLKSYTTIQALS